MPYLQCDNNGDTTVLHWAIELIVQSCIITNYYKISFYLNVHINAAILLPMTNLCLSLHWQFYNGPDSNTDFWWPHWLFRCIHEHYNDVIIGAIATQITSLAIVYSSVYSDADQRNHQSFASLAFVRGIHRGRPHKGAVTRKMFPFDDVIMNWMKFQFLHLSPVWMHFA